MKKNQKKLQVKLVRSTAGSKPKHKLCAKGLGLRGMNHVVQVEDTPCTRGMINKIIHLVSVEEAK